jgi:hypothetical protein
MKKEQLFRDIYKLQQEADEYIKKLPSDIKRSGIIFDNGYFVPQMIIKDKLMEAAFGEHYQSVEWFLYEWEPGFEVRFEDKGAKIYSIDEYIQWMKLNEGFE